MSSFMSPIANLITVGLTIFSCIGSAVETELGDGYYGAETASDNRLFGMFHANTPHHNKDVL